MQGNASLSATTSGVQEWSHLSALPLGFEAPDMARLNRIFQHSPGGRRYTVAPHAAGTSLDIGILLVNYDDPLALAQKPRFSAGAPGSGGLVGEAWANPWNTISGVC